MNAEPIRLAVLGATGFFGAALMRQLASLPPGAVDARALVRAPERFLAPPSVRCVPGSLPDHLPPELFFHGARHVVLHFATEQRGRDERMQAVNVEGTRRLVAALPDCVAGVIYGSSFSVYGNGPQVAIDDRAEVRPETPLARTRRGAEALIFEHADRRGLAALAMRPRFMIGRGDRFLLPALARLQRRRIALGSGEQRFSIIDIDDYAHCVLRLAIAVAEGARWREPLNVSYRRPVSWNELAAAIGERRGHRSVRVRIPAGRSLRAALRLLPGRAARGLAARLELFGQDHFGPGSRLRELVRSERLEREPLEVVGSALDQERR